MNLKDPSLVEEVEKIIKEKGIDAEITWHDYGQKTEDAARTLDVGVTCILKSLIFLDKNRKPIMAIVTGNKRVNTKKLEKLVNSKIRIANADEVLELTNHPVGGVPPIGPNIRTFVDREVMKRGVVYSSAGSPYAGLKIKPKDLVDISGAEVCDISE